MNEYIILFVVIFVVLIIIAPFYKVVSNIYWSRKLKKELDSIFDDNKPSS